MLQQSFLPDEGLFTALPAIKAVNVASVPQRSPFRYPGGKTWFVPAMRQWLGHQVRKPQLLIEPFAGGANVALAALCENRVDHAVLVELDPCVAAVWHVIADGLAPDLANVSNNSTSPCRVLRRRLHSPQQAFWTRRFKLF